MLVLAISFLLIQDFSDPNPPFLQKLPPTHQICINNLNAIGKLITLRPGDLREMTPSQLNLLMGRVRGAARDQEAIQSIETELKFASLPGAYTVPLKQEGGLKVRGVGRNTTLQHYTNCPNVSWSFIEAWRSKVLALIIKEQNHIYENARPPLEVRALFDRVKPGGVDSDYSQWIADRVYETRHEPEAALQTRLAKSIKRSLHSHEIRAIEEWMKNKNLLEHLQVGALISDRKFREGYFTFLDTLQLYKTEAGKIVREAIPEAAIIFNPKEEAKDLDNLSSASLAREIFTSGKDQAIFYSKVAQVADGLINPAVFYAVQTVLKSPDAIIVQTSRATDGPYLIFIPGGSFQLRVQVEESGLVSPLSIQFLNDKELALLPKVYRAPVKKEVKVERPHLVQIELPKVKRVKEDRWEVIQDSALEDLPEDVVIMLQELDKQNPGNRDWMEERIVPLLQMKRDLFDADYLARFSKKVNAVLRNDEAETREVQIATIKGFIQSKLESEELDRLIEEQRKVEPTVVEEEVVESDVSDIHGPISYKDLFTRLKSKGWELDRIHASHYVFVAPNASRALVVPVHGKEISGFYAKAILKDADQFASQITGR